MSSIRIALEDSRKVKTRTAAKTAEQIETPPLATEQDAAVPVTEFSELYHQYFPKVFSSDGRVQDREV